jgi:2-hydroxychromene-2-carboxylate isomerase
MAKTLDFYIDLISPFSYLCNLKLPDLAARYGYTLAYHPIDIPTAKLAAGNYGPSNMKVPAKIKALGQDLHRWAKHYEVPFKFPKGFNGARMNTGMLYAQAHGKVRAYVDRAYWLLWAEGEDPNDDNVLRGLARDAGLDPDALLAYAASREGELAFQESRVQAHARGVYGAPIMMVDDQIWWGNDRLMFVEEYLREHPG